MLFVGRWSLVVVSSFLYVVSCLLMFVSWPRVDCRCGCLMLVAYCLSFTVRGLFVGICCWGLIGSGLLSLVYHLFCFSFVISGVLLGACVVCCSVCVVGCLLFVFWCILVFVSGLLFVVCCLILDV